MTVEIQLKKPIGININRVPSAFKTLNKTILFCFNFPFLTFHTTLKLYKYILSEIPHIF